MATHRNDLPQLNGDLFLTDGGIETTLVFLKGLELPDFAAFTLLKSEPGQAALREYFRSYADLARRHETGLLLETATWRASSDWGSRLGYDRAALADANRAAVELLAAVREQASAGDPMVISGCVGPRGDGYVADGAMSADDAESYHAEQIETFAGTDADMIGAITMTNVDEAIGVARAAQKSGMPVAISFTVETDGKLPSGQPLRDAIAQVDDVTAGAPAYYMINCAHPEHLEGALSEAGAWFERIRGLRANASRKSHAELNESTELEIGDPDELGQQYAGLIRTLTRLNVMGGCCGTDERHVDRIARACVPIFRARRARP